MKNRCIIVEDEIHSLNLIEKLIKEDGRLNIIGKALDGIDAVKLINSYKPDIVFLDINLPEISGIKLVDELEYLPKIIFITAYDNYAIEAFEKWAVDYILKPISFERLHKSIDRVLSIDQIDLDIKSLLGQLSVRKNYITKFLIRERSSFLIIPQEDVFYFKAEDKYIFLCNYDSEFFYDKSLKELVSLLDPEIFIRIHKSYIVNINKIKRIHKLFGNKYKIEMIDLKNTKLPVGRMYLKQLLEKFK